MRLFQSAALLLAVSLAAAVFEGPVQRASAAGVAVPPATADHRKPDLSPYLGLGTWVDVYDGKARAHPAATVREMHERGVHTLFVQTANYASPRALMHRRALDRFLSAAHRRGMQVVAWYLPSFVHLRADLHRSLAAVRYRSEQGDRFDSFGLDIEAPLVFPLSERKARLVTLSRRIRASVRPSFTLSAITPSPYGMREVPQYWGPVRRFPFAELARSYDLIAPMGYFTHRVSGMREVYGYVTYNIRIIRRLSRSDVPLHPIGGLSRAAGRLEVRGYVDALRDAGIGGGSMYDYVGMKPAQWRELRRVPG